MKTKKSGNKIRIRQSGNLIYSKQYPMSDCQVYKSLIEIQNWEDKYKSHSLCFSNRTKSKVKEHNGPTRWQTTTFQNQEREDHVGLGSEPTQV